MKLLKYGAAMLLLLASVMLFAREDGGGKMSRWVRMVAQQEAKKASQQQAMARATTTEEDGQAEQGGNEKEPDKRMMTVFVLMQGDDVDDVMARYGCRKFTQLDDIVVARVPLQQLEALSQDISVRRVEANQSAMLTTDTTARIVDALSCYAATEEHQAFTGDGVVVGVMDVGFDLTHPLFYDASRSLYRVGALWDQLSKDTVGSALPVGRDYVGTTNVLAHQSSVDTPKQQHGTHTAGIVGSGDSKYRGLAFDSELCLVSNAVGNDEDFIDENDKYLYTTATDAMGFKYLFDYAASQGKPCVASFSEGYPPYIDGEDSLYSAFIDKLLGPGRILVASAGNEGLKKTYVNKPVGTAAAGAFLDVSNDEALYKVKADGRCRLNLYAYRNGSSTPTDMLSFDSDDERLNDGIIDSLFIDGDTCALQVLRTDAQMIPEDILYFVMKANKPLSLLVPLALAVEGADTHAELFGSSTNALKNSSLDSRWNAAEIGHNVFAPGCFEPVICVGATTHRLMLTNIDGGPISWTTATVKGLHADYSSTGPSMNGLMKPDVMAPGTNVVSGYNSFHVGSPVGGSFRVNTIAVDDFNGRQYAWGLNSGTSMATPVVAGIIALWLQADPTLTRDDVMDIISKTSRKLDPEATYPNALDGYGEIQAHAGLIEVLKRKSTGLAELSYEQAQQVRASCNNGLLTISFDRPATAPVHIRVYSLTGILLADKICEAGQRIHTFSLPQVERGIVAIQINSADKVLCGSLLVRE